jgi:hypothetical protein
LFKPAFGTTAGEEIAGTGVAGARKRGGQRKIGFIQK